MYWSRLPVRSLACGCIDSSFGLKSAFFPFHSWLPRTHAAAPTHVSALTSEGATAPVSAAATGGHCRSRHRHAGEELAQSSCKGSFKLRFVHRGTSRQTALSCLIAKLKHGSTPWSLVGSQATTPTRRDVVDRRGAGAHRFTVLRPLLVDDPRRDLLGHRLRLAAL